MDQGPTHARAAAALRSLKQKGQLKMVHHTHKGWSNEGGGVLCIAVKSTKTDWGACTKGMH
eukprot:scaffold27763_cov169-Isochrysis_galbana.AAC.1